MLLGHCHDVFEKRCQYVFAVAIFDINARECVASETGEATKRRDLLDKTHVGISLTTTPGSLGLHTRPSTFTWASMLGWSLKILSRSAHCIFFPKRVNLLLRISPRRLPRFARGKSTRGH